MKAQLDMDKIAKGLGAERCGEVAAKGGYFGAHHLAAEVHARFRVPTGGGRTTVRQWTEGQLLDVDDNVPGESEIKGDRMRLRGEAAARRYNFKKARDEFHKSMRP